MKKLTSLLLATIVFFNPGCASMKPETKLKWKQTASVLGGVATQATISFVLSKATGKLDKKNKDNILYGVTDGLRRSQDEILTVSIGDGVGRVWGIWTDQSKPHWQQLKAATKAIAEDGVRKGYSKDVVIESLAREIQKAITETEKTTTK